MAMMRLRREDPRVVGSFRLHRRLGAGGMGVVYLGSDRRGQRVALKVIRPDLAEDPEFRSRFAREVSAARRIRGGCTARLVAADLEAERPWFATQYVPGPSLHDKVSEGGPLPAAQVASVGAALAEGLVAVHEAGVVHRDLKPSNILLSPKGPRIIDFGIAWATGASTLTHVGTAVGSPGFLAPEQVRGASVTPATDVFALGATLAYAATADSPFGQGSSEVMLYRVVHEEPQLHGVHAALAPLIRACLVKAPEERPSTLQLSLRLKEIAAREARGLPEVIGGTVGYGGLSASAGAGGVNGTGSGQGRALGAGHGGHRPADGHGDASGGSAGAPASGTAHGNPSSRGGSGHRPPGRRAQEYAAQHTERHRVERPRERGAAGDGGSGSGAAGHGSSHPVHGGHRPGDGHGGHNGHNGHGGHNTAGSSRASAARAGERGEERTGGRTGGQAGTSRPGKRQSTGRTGGRPATGPGGRPRRPGAGGQLLRQRLVVFVTVTLLVALGIAAAQGCQGPPHGAGSAPARPSHTAVPSHTATLHG